MFICTLVSLIGRGLLMMREELNQARCFGGKPVVKTGRTHSVSSAPELFEPGIRSGKV